MKIQKQQAFAAEKRITMDSIKVSSISKSYAYQDLDIVVDHARKPLRSRTVLQDLSLEFPIGHLTVIVGRSGCGKSTLLKLLDGTEKADSGSIELPERWHTATLRPDPYVITWTSVLRNVEMSAGAGRSPEERHALAEELIWLVQLGDYLDVTPLELSTGMKQRLGLARVLASRAQILLLDEPFASLDFITREELQQVLLQLQSRMPRTIILVTHQLEEALLLAEKIVVMHPDSTVREFDLTGFAYPRDLEQPAMRALKEEIASECRK